jgi:hypothetical protein
MPPVDEGVDVAALAKAADLHLSKEQLEIVGPIVSEWRLASLELNRKMSDPSRAHWVPMTVLVHGGAGHE